MRKGGFFVYSFGRRALHHFIPAPAAIFVNIQIAQIFGWIFVQNDS
jgi:hypothetical protein